MSKNHIVVIGGGYTGLSAAYKLSKLSNKVTLIEKEKDLLTLKEKEKCEICILE